MTFARSTRTVPWLPADGNLLDFAEAQGVETRSSCRSGMCGTCSTRLLSGKVRYDDEVEADIEPGHALICMAHPVVDDAHQDAGVVLDL